MRYNKNNVIQINDIKNLVLDYLEKYKVEQYEKNIRMWFSEKIDNDFIDEGQLKKNITLVKNIYYE